MSKIGIYADLPLPEEWQGIVEGLRPASLRRPQRELSALGHLVDACLHVVDDERNRALIWGRFGAGQTLQEAGDAHGITRERVRQVVNRSSRLFLRNARVRQIADAVFAGLGREGPILLSVRGAFSAEQPGASPEQLWDFMLNIWREVQKRQVQSVPLGDDLYLFSPQPLPSEREVARRMAERGSFLYPAQLAALLEVAPNEVEAVACGLPRLVRTQSGLYGLRGWTLPQLLKAVAEQLARAGFTEWHFSQIGKAAAFFDTDLEHTPSRNFAAVLSRSEVNSFEHAGRDGCWRLASLGDGHGSNLEAIRAVLEEADTPLHWTDIQERLSRQVHDGTVVALLTREPDFVNLGRSVFGLRDRAYDTMETQTEEAFMRDLFRQMSRDWVPAMLAEDLAAGRGLDVQQLRRVGRVSEEFRFWKWGTGEVLYVTPEEANRRFFRRWFASREDRELPETDVLLAGLRLAFEQRDRDILCQTYECLRRRGGTLPPEAAHWVDWALG